MPLEPVPPVVQELFKLLPAPGAEWCNSDRIEWLRAAEACFRVVYKTDDPTRLFIDEAGARR